jgi:hypothetical protein
LVGAATAAPTVRAAATNPENFIVMVWWVGFRRLELTGS